MTLYVTELNKEEIFVQSSTDVRLVDTTGKSGLARSVRNWDCHGCTATSLEVGGVMPYGTVAGDKVYLLYKFRAGESQFIGTAYEYEWVVTE